MSGSQRVGQGLGHQAAREGHPLLALAPGLTCAVILFPRCWASALPRDLCAHIEVTRGDGQLSVSSVPLSWVPDGSSSVGDRQMGRNGPCTDLAAQSGAVLQGQSRDMYAGGRQGKVAQGLLGQASGCALVGGGALRVGFRRGRAASCAGTHRCPVGRPGGKQRAWRLFSGGREGRGAASSGKPWS